MIIKAEDVELRSGQSAEDALDELRARIEGLEAALALSGEPPTDPLTLAHEASRRRLDKERGRA